jgi:aldehyde:ferredoxin oxidoreductase
MNSYGYAGKILEVDLSSRKQATLSTRDYSERFLGGRGIAARIYWDRVAPDTGALAPGNTLVFMTGPLAGFTRFSGCRWQICGKSPEMSPEHFSYANLGGSWGAWLKYAGFDGLVVSGSADKPSVLVLQDGRADFRDGSPVWGETTIETQHTLQQEYGPAARVLTIGPAGEQQVTFATVLAAENASGSSGFGAVMGAKNLKAVVVIAAEKQRPTAAHPAALNGLAEKTRQLRTTNFEDYGHILPLKTRFTACYGCISGCTRGMYEADDGRTYKHFCQAGGVYSGPARRRNGDGTQVGMLAERLCDQYGLDTGVISPLIDWLGRCYERGLLNEKETGLPLSEIGSASFIERLIKIISLRQGFGDLLSGGILNAARILGNGAEELIGSSVLTRAGETRDHDPRLMLANSLLLAMEPRKPVYLIHASSLPLSRWMNWKAGWKDAFISDEIFQGIAERYWGGLEAGDFSTYQGKALAARKIQDYGYVKESLVVCDLAWPIYPVKDFANGPRPFELESQILSAITGRAISPPELESFGGKIFNLQRAVLQREGWGGRQGDRLLDYLHSDPLQGVFYDPQAIAPGKNGSVISRKNAVVEKDAFEALKDEYYALRGWDTRGYQTGWALTESGLRDVAEDLESRGLLSPEAI